MATKNLKEELRKLDEEEARIREQRTKLREEAKTQALAAVTAAIDELNALGYSYRLAEGKAAPASRPAPRAAAGGRRTGFRKEVLAVIAEAADGLTPAAIRDKLNIASDDKSGSQAVSNALSALKRQSKIADKDGAYVTA